MTLDEARARVGAKVIYSSVPGEADAGEIIAAGAKYVHVLYAGQPNAKATPPELLTLMRGGSVREHFRLNMADSGFPVATWKD